MGYIKLFESWRREETIILTNKHNSRYRIEIKVLNGKIEEIDNEAKIKFPFFTGQPITVFMKQWACNNNFLWNDEDPCGEKKIFGIKKDDIPTGHPLRLIYPSKFKK